MKHRLVVVLALIVMGCGQVEPPRSGGRTASYWVEVLQKPDPDVDLRRKAAAKLGTLVLKDSGAMPALLGALKDPDSDVRSATIRSLMIYSGPRSKEALPGLKDVKDHDPDPTIRDEAAKAIDKLTKGASK